MTKTKRKKQLGKIKKKRAKLVKNNLALMRKVRKLGFKSAQEFKLYEALKNEGISVYHNIILLYEEIDLFVPPKIIIEIGFRDEKLLEKWEKFEKQDYEFMYFSNLEVDSKETLNRIVQKIKDKVARAIKKND